MTYIPFLKLGDITIDTHSYKYWVAKGNLLWNCILIEAPSF